jgi:hypothetical protein
MVFVTLAVDGGEGSASYYGCFIFKERASSSFCYPTMLPLSMESVQTKFKPHSRKGRHGKCVSCSSLPSCVLCTCTVCEIIFFGVHYK